MNRTMIRTKYLLKWVLPSGLFLLICYILLDLNYEQIKVVHEGSRYLPLSGFANNVIFPFSESISQTIHMSLILRVIISLILPYLFVAPICIFVAGLLLSIKHIGSLTISIITGAIGLPLVYFIFMIECNALNLPAIANWFTLASCLFAMGCVIVGAAYISDIRCSRCHEDYTTHKVRYELKGIKKLDVKRDSDNKNPHVEATLEYKTYSLCLNTSCLYKAHATETDTVELMKFSDKKDTLSHETYKSIINHKARIYAYKHIIKQCNEMIDKCIPYRFDIYNQTIPMECDFLDKQIKNHEAMIVDNEENLEMAELILDTLIHSANK